MVIDRRANANPTKSFFVRMLTRDISLDDCILDLVDNSVDGAWKSAGASASQLLVDDTLAGFHIAIELSETSFRIVDNCGGISLDDAAEYAFTFGRREEQDRGDYTVGVYGIGMKRAVFKLGRRILIKSTYGSGADRQAFMVPIDVNAWLAESEGPWDFDIDEAPASAEAGVDILVEDLTGETAARLSDPTHERALRRVLARDYMVPLMRGLTITVNGVKVEGWRLELRANESFQPMRTGYLDGAVRVELIAGMASPPPDDREPDERAKPEDVSGWYVLCNGRVVLAADTSRLTGWGLDLPKWHLQYSGFVGAVFFSSENPELLPMTTTKRSVDVSSAVYQRALVRMHEPARAWVSYTNARKQDQEAAKPAEVESIVLDVTEVQVRDRVLLPEPVRHASRERVANVNYSVPLKRLRALAAGFGDERMTYRDVGIRSFEYAYDDLAVED